MSFAVVKWHKLQSYVSRASLGPILSISGAVVSLGCIAAGFYPLAVITAGANLLATRLAIQAIQSQKKIASGRIDKRHTAS
jgi:hypothetical protein